MSPIRLVAVCLSLVLLSGTLPGREEKAPDLPTRIKAIKGPFTLIVTFQVKKGQEKTLIDAAKPCIAATRKEAGCELYEMNQDQEDSTKFIFVEKWKSSKALLDHLEAEHTKKLVEVVGKITVGEPKFTFCKSGG